MMDTQEGAGPLGNEQKAREFQKLKEIEAERAKERQGTRNDLVENFPQCSEGKSRDLAAAKVGMSGKTAEKAAEVKSKAGCRKVAVLFFCGVSYPVSIFKMVSFLVALSESGL